MRKRISTVRRRKPRSVDFNQAAFNTVQATIERSEAAVLDKNTISAVMKALGSKGGKIGGKRRLETMTQEERSQSALRAARARWAKNRKG